MENTNLYGLVLGGGESSRMGVDKSTLSYHGLEQRYHLYKSLSRICSAVYISAHRGQRAMPPYTLIFDQPDYAGHGPISGLLTAFDLFPSKDILLVGCDYPFLEHTDLVSFVASVPQRTTAAAFYNTEEKCYEPVLALYSSAAALLLKEYFHHGNSSLKKFLEQVGAFQYSPANMNAMRSVDTFAEYLEATKQLDRNLKPHKA